MVKVAVVSLEMSDLWMFLLLIIFSLLSSTVWTQPTIRGCVCCSAAPLFSPTMPPTPVLAPGKLLLCRTWRSEVITVCSQCVRLFPGLSPWSFMGRTICLWVCSWSATASGRRTSAPACSVRLPWCITSAASSTVAAACKSCWRSWIPPCRVINTPSSTTRGAASANRWGGVGFQVAEVAVFLSVVHSLSAALCRWPQWCLYPTIRGPCLLPNIWSFVSTATSTPDEPTPSPADTPSTKTTTSTSPTTRWWLPSGWSLEFTCTWAPADKHDETIVLNHLFTVIQIYRCNFIKYIIVNLLYSHLFSYTSVRLLEICLPRPKIFIRNLGPSKANLQQDLKDFSQK